MAMFRRKRRRAVVATLAWRRTLFQHLLQRADVVRAAWIRHVHAGLRIRNDISTSAGGPSARTSRISGARSRLARSTASLSVDAEAGQPSQLPSRATYTTSPSIREICMLPLCEL